MIFAQLHNILNYKNKYLFKKYSKAEILILNSKNIFNFPQKINLIDLGKINLFYLLPQLFSFKDLKINYYKSLINSCSPKIIISNHIETRSLFLKKIFPEICFILYQFCGVDESKL